MSNESTRSNKFITYNDIKDCYEWYDDINQQLTVYRVDCGDTDVVVNIYQSPILQANRKDAEENLQWRTKMTYGKAFIGMLSDALNNHNINHE